jgi:hypothetical protein
MLLLVAMEINFWMVFRAVFLFLVARMVDSSERT